MDKKHKIPAAVIIVAAGASLPAACCSADSMSKVSLSSGMLKSNSGSECTSAV